MYENFSCFAPLTALGIVNCILLLVFCFLMFISFYRSIVVFYCSFVLYILIMMLIEYHYEHLLMCLFANYKSSMMKCLFKFFACFINCVVSLLLSFDSSFYNLDIRLLFDICSIQRYLERANIPFLMLLFILLMSSREMILNLIKSNLSSF